MKLSGNPPDEITHAWEDVKAMFNGGTRKRILSNIGGIHVSDSERKRSRYISETIIPSPPVIQSPLPNTAKESSISEQQVPIISNLTLPLPSSDYTWHQKPESSFTAVKESSLSLVPYIPWLTKRSSIFFSSKYT